MAVISHLGQNVNRMGEKWITNRGYEGQNTATTSNVKESAKYERFGDTIRYMTWGEWQQFLSCIDNHEHKLMIQTIYELGCRVGEFVRIRLRDIDFRRGHVYFPRENTKTGRRRVSHLPQGVVNDLKSWLKREGRMAKRSENIKAPTQYLFSPLKKFSLPYTENRLRQIFRRYSQKAGLDRSYGLDSKGRLLHELTVHSLRHTHIMHYIHIHKLPIAVVQKQVGHTSLKTTSVYLNPSDEAVADAYRAALKGALPQHHNS